VAAGTRTPDDDFTYVGEIIDDAAFSPYVCALDRATTRLPTRLAGRRLIPLFGVTLKDDYPAGVVRAGEGHPRRSEQHSPAALLRVDGRRDGVDFSALGTKRLKVSGCQDRCSSWSS
jgi:hypothetical protein